MTKISLEETQHKASQIPRMDQELNNPCLQEHLMAMECLNKNDYVQQRCEPFFENYKICKKFWRYVTADRKSNGIEPVLPLPEDRKKVKAEYIKTFVPH